MREFEEAWTKARIVLEFGHVLLDVGGGDASFTGKSHSLFGVDRAACGHVAECPSLDPGEIVEANQIFRDGTTAYMTAR